MSKEEKLKAIISKAAENGNKMAKEWQYLKYDLGEESLLFDKSFAKAYFGEEMICTYCGLIEKKHDNGFCADAGTLWAYLYHLQQAVISDDVVDYYYKNI